MATAAIVLRVAGKPLEVDDLLALAGVDVSLASFRRHLQHDDRFLRCGVRRYGLSEWGGDPYTTIAEKMSEEIERNGGAVGLDALARSMAERFGVAEGSVRKQARSPRFAVDSAGRVSRRA